MKKLFILLLVLGALIFYCPVIIETCGKSMMPTILDGEYVLAVSNTSIDRGDIVIIKARDCLLVKRIIGLPHEKVEIINNKTYINGVENDEPYTIHQNMSLSFSASLSKDEYFVMGDNRPDSNDSRFFGPIKKSNIVREVKFIFNIGRAK